MGFRNGKLIRRDSIPASALQNDLPSLVNAAEQGNVKAQFSCGVMYHNGEGTAADKAKALYWYEKAAEQGHTKAQLNCGLMYYKGEGTAVDMASPCTGSKKPPNRATPRPNSSVALCTSMAKEHDKTCRKQGNGRKKLLSKVMKTQSFLWLRSYL